MQVVPFFAFFFLWHFTLADCRRLFFFPAILSSLSQPTVFCSSTNTCGLARFTDWCFPLCGTRRVLSGQTISGCCWWTCSTADDSGRVTPTGRTVSAGDWRTRSCSTPDEWLHATDVSTTTYISQYALHTHTHTHTRLTAPFPDYPGESVPER